LLPSLLAVTISIIVLVALVIIIIVVVVVAVAVAVPAALEVNNEFSCCVEICHNCVAMPGKLQSTERKNK